MLRNRRKGKAGSYLSATAIVLSVALLAFILPYLNVFQELELRLYDLDIRRRGPLPVSDSQIALVVIDEQTADSLSFPFDRKHYATLIQKLNKLGARRIVFDINFTSTGSIPSSDSLLFQAIEDAGNVILSGKIDMQYVPGIKDPLTKPVRPVPQVAPPGTPVGQVNDIIDQDGVMRIYPLFIPSRDTAFFSLGLKTLAIEKGWDIDSVIYNEKRDLVFGDLEIPTYHLNSTLLNFYGPAGTFPTYSFVDVVNGAYDFDDFFADLSAEELEILADAGAMDIMSESPFKDRIVLLGASAEDLQDNKFTPFFSAEYKRKTPGVEVHANAIEMFLHNNYIRQINLGWIIAGIILVSLISLLLERGLGRWYGLLGAGFMLILIPIAGWIFFEKWGLWLQQIPLMMSVVIGYPANLVYSVILAQREKAQLRGMFGHYVSPLVIDELTANPEKLTLSGERRRMSVLFTDIQGFTTVSEKLSPEELVDLLKEYLTAMTETIQENDGIIDKYEGDLIMAEFGAPIWYEDHAARCCRASLRMQSKLKAMRKVWRSQGRDALYSRVGVNTGEMHLGNMGSKDVFDYTVMGDAVNLSSRLEGANKSYGTTIMIGKETWLDVKEDFITRPLDLLQVKGKLEGVEVFELLAENESELSSGKLKAVETFIKGLEFYRNRDFKQAVGLFNRALEIDPKDSPSRVYFERCNAYISNPPPEDWKGVFVLTEK